MCDRKDVVAEAIYVTSTGRKKSKLGSAIVTVIITLISVVLLTADLSTLDNFVIGLIGK